MAESIVTPIVDIISRLLPCCARHTRYLCKLQENKNLLRNALKELTDKRNDVQRRVVEAEADPNEPKKKRTDQVCGWLQDVQITEDEVEEILQKVDILNGRCLGGFCPPNKCWGNYKLGKSIAKKIPLVDKLKGKGHFEELTYNLPLPPVQDMNLEPTVGMESMFDKVWRLLITSTTTDDKVVRIMGLYGHGGVGKTTLLMKINNEFNKICGEQGFDHIVMFVVVSKPINYEAIQKTIEKRLGLSESLKEDGDESSRADKIFNQLKNKNFVILLDDLWGRVDFQRIGIPSTPPQGKSQVIFTTRSMEVCGLMEATHKFQVECLPWDKAWRLFQDKVGEEVLSSISRQGAPELTKDVAKECGGLPLALITIGRAMSSRKSVKEWKDALRTLKKSASEFQGMGDEVLPRLKLSYDNLPKKKIKSCFLYCALYPEDHSIEIAQLIDYWIGEGFLNEFDKLDDARSHGHHVIETLKRACLLEESSNEYGEYGENVKMHDVIRDLALWIVNGCKSNNSKTTGKFLVVASNNNNVCERWTNAERIFCNNDDSYNEWEWEEPPRSSDLLTLIATNDYIRLKLPQSFFQFTPFLRVLDLSNTNLLELPTSIGELSDLQYLGLANTNIRELPVELRKLVKLKFLDLSTRKLIKIPAGVIANLSELQVLKLGGVLGFKDWELKEEGVGLSFGELDRLKQVQELEIVINTSLALEKLLLCNQKLRMGCTYLRCENIKSISLPSSSSSSISEGGLVNLKSLEYYKLSSSSVELEELTSFIINGAAGLLKNKINVYHHAVSPFQNLDTITIDSCDELKDLTWLVYVENLKTLYVYLCDRLETIIIELGDDGLQGTAARGGRVFGRLKTLVINELPKLKSICRHALAFPSIETITIHGCRGLKKLPLDSGSNINNTLKQIEGSREWWNELQWEDETIKSKFLPYCKQSPFLLR